MSDLFVTFSQVHLTKFCKLGRWCAGSAQPRQQWR